MGKSNFDIDEENVSSGKTMGILSYVTIIGLIVAIIMNNDKKNPFASFHIRQSLGIGITGLALAFINILPIVGWIIYFVGLFIILCMWIMGLLSAVNGKKTPVFLLGEKYQLWFKDL